MPEGRSNNKTIVVCAVIYATTIVCSGIMVYIS
jgi:hypothetical protein